MAIHSNILDWRIPWTEEPGRLQFMGLQRVKTCLRDHTYNIIQWPNNSPWYGCGTLCLSLPWMMNWTTKNYVHLLTVTNNASMKFVYKFLCGHMFSFLCIPRGHILCLNFWNCLTIFNGEGDGTPLQYSCLENHMDGGAWWAIVHGVARSGTRLSDFTFTFHFHALERKWQPTPVFLSGESRGWGSLVGCRLWGPTESDTTEAT